jgi:hypothetical protein
MNQISRARGTCSHDGDNRLLGFILRVDKDIHSTIFEREDERKVRMNCLLARLQVLGEFLKVTEVKLGITVEQRVLGVDWIVFLSDALEDHC